jgi:glycerol-3-phosphate dehydrogenase (NAD(P)+)
MQDQRENSTRLPGVRFPKGLRVCASAPDPAPVCLMAVPMQSLAPALRERAPHLAGRDIVACCKGVDLETGLGATGIIGKICPDSKAAILSGPSFAADIARGLPTALTIATPDPVLGQRLQDLLSTEALRLYRSQDVVGVELGGALKNVIAIAAGITIGAGLGESARAALMTRGYAEMRRFAGAFGAELETLSGLSGFGDLVLTCMSEKSRNYSHGLTLGRGETADPTTTVEGIATAKAVARIALDRKVEMPVTASVASLIDGEITIQQAVTALMSRPLKEE